MLPLWTRSRHAPALKCCKLQYGMDLTLPKCKRNGRFFIFTDFYNRQSTFSSQIATCIYQDFERHPPKWVSAIHCAIWLRLSFQGRGSACFLARIFCFFMPGSVFAGKGRILGPGVNLLARGPFGVKNGSRKKKYFCDEIIL